jgi:SAM-dependent methyltransferase
MVATLTPHFIPGPEAWTPFLEHSHALYDRWAASLEPWLRGEPWTTQPRGREGTRVFGAAMQAMGAQVARMAAEHIDLAGVRRLLDVGGGFGQYARALCARKPDIEPTVLDRPEVVDLAREALAGTEWEGRIAFIGGDYHEADYGDGYDLVLNANILHQEPAERAAAIIRRSAAALAPGGRVVVLDFAIDDERHAPLLGTLFAVNMRSLGDTHTSPAITGWMEASGLARVERLDFNRHRWLIIGHRE